MNEEIKLSGLWANIFKTVSDKDDFEVVISGLPPFKDLSRKYLKELLKLVHTRTYSAGEVIFSKDDPGMGLFIVRMGEVKVFQPTEDGKEFIFANYTRGDFFGELALLDNEVRTATAAAVKETNLAIIFKPDLDDFINQYPRQGLKILRGLSKIIITRLKLINRDHLNLYQKLIQLNKETEDVFDKENISAG
ncbi:MAG: cyclic nucleotide-binding domain-containing protein [Ignavibacteria bacterium]|nr:cyclic nucleotide-binding domain-containing protein [Ignavibacteria bacterium]